MNILWMQFRNSGKMQAKKLHETIWGIHDNEEKLYCHEFPCYFNV